MSWQPERSARSDWQRVERAVNTPQPLMTDLAPADIMMEANRVASATTLYEVLGVSHSATEIDIRRKYREVSPLPLRRTI